MATIRAENTEIAKATGSNINSSGDESDFDLPLTDMTDLVIYTPLLDFDPYMFDLGETHTLTWNDGDGAHTMYNAEVVRSDLKWGTANQGAVVFEGTDTDGNDAQILWTPDLNVHQWYADTQADGKHPMFWNVDQHSSTYGYVCFAAETRIETDKGLKRIDSLKVGDRVATLDNGYQEIRWVGHHRTDGRGDAAPIHIAKGAMGRNQALRLSPQHKVVIRDVAFKQVLGQAQVMVAAKSLEGRPGVTRQPVETVDYYNILFDRHEVIFAEGLACESLYLGQIAETLIDPDAVDPTQHYPDLARLKIDRHPEMARPTLTVGEARRYFGLLDADLVAA
ncbi:Hint domain-containing protein [Maritimibacter sp. UBA3975]|uniref:Hint domain-containing protein n=1 Tax=Maritimibacter sp. UBA3975 TaxID=1946833 RepID=UPI000C09CFDA|nr:Hint domain-containing protein [Maritimibacter sp. UBA3975]MAM61604.1 hypothetical protein [Maritimibacter sp.]|tara:strand:- start:21757 stop:22764 length:1008 start_codon:yes stop_codon:yes gene_type:complete